VLDQGLVRDLQRRTGDLSGKVNQLQQQVQDQQQLLTILQNFDQSTRSALVSGRLAGSRVVLVTEEGVDLQDLNGVRQTLSGTGGAGATIDGILELNKKLDLQDEQVRTAVAAMLDGSAGDSPHQLSDALARALAERLATGPPAE